MCTIRKTPSDGMWTHFFYLKNAITPALALCLYARERDMKMWSDVNIICFLCIAAINLAVGAKSVPIKNIFGLLY
jgi:hypothetical protein